MKELCNSVHMWVYIFFSHHHDCFFLVFSSSSSAFDKASSIFLAAPITHWVNMLPAFVETPLAVISRSYRRRDVTSPNIVHAWDTSTNLSCIVSLVRNPAWSHASG